MNRVGDWWALAGGAATGLGISTVQRMYPDISFIALLGVGLVFGALFNVTMRAVSKWKGKKR